MKREKQSKNRQPMSTAGRWILGVAGVVIAAIVVYVVYYLIHYSFYNDYKSYLSSYEYEEGGAYSPIAEAAPDVPGFELVAESDSLKLYTDTARAYVAVYDKRNGKTVYSNPLNADEDTVANDVNKAYLKSQFLLYYYNSDVTSGSMSSYAESVAGGNYSWEGIAGGIRYIYQVGSEGGVHFTVPLEYRLEDDHLEVSIPVSGIEEYNEGYIYQIQLLRYMGAATYGEEGYMVVPNGSGSLINFNNGKSKKGNYSQYIYGIDPLAADYTTLENQQTARLPIYGICREDSSVLVSVEDGAANAMLTAAVSGTDCDYNYAYPTFVLRVADNLRMFGDATQDVFVMEPDAYDVNLCCRYTFLTDEYSGYSGIASYYRERLVAEGQLTERTEGGDIPFYYDVIGGVVETTHFLGIAYDHTFSMTDFDEAGQISDALLADNISNQVMNFQGWFNGGYYHDAADDVHVTRLLGGKSGLEDLNATLAENGGILYADTAFQQVSKVDDHYSDDKESARYYGAGYVATFGLVNPTTLRNTSGLGYSSNIYSLVSPKYLPRYVKGFIKDVNRIDVAGISLRDLGNVLTSDKKRTNQITREEALDVVLGQLDLLEGTGKALMTSEANSYAFAYSTDVINVPLSGSSITITDEDIPLYEMIVHGYVSYGSDLLNYENSDDLDKTVLRLIEAGASPHYVFTWESASRMKNTALNRYYNTTFESWEQTAADVYARVNDALSAVSGAAVTEHTILGDIRRISYDNGVVIYVNYAKTDGTADGRTVPAMGYLVEGGD